MKVKDLLAMCDNEKLLACITAHYRDANGRTAGIEEVTALYLPVLEERSGITPISDGQHFVLASRRENGMKVMDFYRPGLEKWFQNMSAQILLDMTDGGLTSEAINARRHELEELLKKTEYSSLNELLVKTLPQSLTKEQLLEWKIKWANFNCRVYHLLLQYEDLWSN